MGYFSLANFSLHIDYYHIHHNHLQDNLNCYYVLNNYYYYAIDDFYDVIDDDVTTTATTVIMAVKEEYLLGGNNPYLVNSITSFINKQGSINNILQNTHYCSGWLATIIIKLLDCYLFHCLQSDKLLVDRLDIQLQA